MTEESAPAPRSFEQARGFLDRVGRAVVAKEEREARRASATPARAIPQKWLNLEASWQRRVRTYDREGPGFLGFTFDLKAQVAAMVPLHMEQLDRQGKWVRSTDPAAQAALAAFVGVGADQVQLIYAQFRSLQSVGEYWLCAVDTPEGLRWIVAQTPQLEFRAQGEVILRTRQDESPNDPTVFRLSKSQVVRCHHPDPEWSGEAYSAVRRALPDIERYRSTVRNITRTLDSRLLTNGLIWFAPDDPDRPQRAEPDTAIQTVEQVMADYTEIAWKALNDDSDFASFAPFPVSGASAPEYIEVGRNLDPEVMEAETKALEAVGRSLDFPQQLLVEGPGAGNHWSDLLLKDDFLTTSIAPCLGEVCGYVTTVAVRPMLSALRARGMKLEEPERYRVSFDLTEVAKRPDTSDQMLKAWEEGVANMATVGQAIGLGEDELLQLPEGVSEYEHWLAAHTRSSSPSSAPRAPDPALAPAMSTTAAAGSDHHESVMIAVVPESPEGLAVEDGLAPSDLHVTLGFFGKLGDLTPDQVEGLVAAVEAVRQSYRPLDLRVGGTAMLGDDDPQATALLVEHEALGAMHEEIIRAAADAGVEDASSHPGFVPHMTVGYGVAAPEGVSGSTIRAATMRLALGDRVLDFPLGTDAMTAALRSGLRRYGLPRTAAPSEIDLGAPLFDIDRRLFDRLSGAAEVAFIAALRDAGRRVMRLLPKGELRESLRAVPLEEVWFRIPADVRASLGVSEIDIVGDDPFGALGEEARAALDEADRAIAATMAGAGIEGAPPEGDNDAAVGFLLAALAALAAARLNDPNPPEPQGEFDPFRRVPPGIIRDTERVAAGASHSNGSLVRDVDGRPQRSDGTWIGGDGPASGPRTVRWILGRPNVSASPVSYEWVHGSPKRPFPPHSRLNGKRYTAETRDEVLAHQGWPGSPLYPGDHAGCTCLERTILKLRVGIGRPA